MACTEAYREHIMYSFNAFCKVVIRYAAINAWRDRNRRRQKEISFEYLTEEKFYPLSTSDEFLKSPYEQYPVTICGQTIILTNGELAAALLSLPEKKREIIYLYFFGNYTQQEIADLYGQCKSTAWHYIKDRLQRNKAAINAPKNDGVQRMIDIAAKKAEGKGRGYEKWATLHNLKQMAATMSIYEESGFSSPEELEAALAAASAEMSNVHAELKSVESTLREKKDLQKQLLAYIKTKPARDGLKAQKTEKARRNYREQHESDFIIAEAATRFFKAQGIQKLPASKTLQAEIEQLMSEKNSLYNEYREKRERTKELQTVKGNIEQILRREPERRKGRENER